MTEKSPYLQCVKGWFVPTQFVGHGGQEAVIGHHRLRKTKTQQAKSSVGRSAVRQIRSRTFGPVFRSRKQPVPYLRHIALLVHETHKGQQSEDRKSPTCSWPGRPESTSVPREPPTGPRDTVWTERVNLSGFGAPSVRGGNVKDESDLPLKWEYRTELPISVKTRRKDR